MLNSAKDAVPTSSIRLFPISVNLPLETVKAAQNGFTTRLTNILPPPSAGIYLPDVTWSVDSKGIEHYR